jgi:hypothetical protein
MNCEDCKFHENWGESGDQYHHMCVNPRLQALITKFNPPNRGVRCNETREFDFACGADAAWFESK